MKIAVYAICKNESKFVDRWMDSMSEADEITVLDTGSEDDTVEKLRARGARVFEEKIAPWRFDVARNRSLELVSPDVDVCVCTDLDEVLHAGWAELLRKAWKPGATLATYRYTWSFTPDGKEGVVFWYSKVHSRYGYRWKHPVHEVLEWKSRAQYLPLLEMSVKEEPSDDRNVHYLGREYMFRRRWDDCIVTLKKHLALPTATWRDERAASMRFIARSYAMKGDKAEAENWYMRAITEAPYLREPYTDFASFLYYSDDWDGVLYFTSRALAIKERPRSYICEAAAWGSLPDDLRSIAFYKTGRIKEALEAAERALTFEPNNDRIRENAEFFRKELGKT